MTEDDPSGEDRAARTDEGRQGMSEGETMTETEAITRGKTGDPAAMEWLTGKYRNLICMIARRYTNVGFEYEDHISECYLGLHHAVETFDPTHGASFATWVYIRMQNQVVEAIRTVTGRYGQRLPILETDSLDRHIRGHSGGVSTFAAIDRIVDVLPDLTPPPDIEERDCLEAWFMHLSDREQYAIYLYAAEGLPYRAIGEAMGICESRAYQLVQQARKRSKRYEVSWTEGTAREVTRNTQAKAKATGKATMAVLRKAA
jgi:RNA polymerase sigma factor (sigma-70 family)